MTEALSDEDYSLEVLHRVMQAIVLIDDDGTGQGGYVRAKPAMDGLALAVATMYCTQNPGMSPRDIRKIVSGFSDALTQSMKTLAQRQRDGGDLWVRAEAMPEQ